jgi:hypothetical protein
MLDAWTTAYAAAALRGRKLLPVVQTRHILDVDGALLKVLPRERDRALLVRRLGEYLNSSRRGRLRLPLDFPQEVRRLIGLTKSQIRRSQFWVKPRTGIHQRLSKPLVNWINRVAPGDLWTSVGNIPIQEANSVVKRLSVRDAPRITRALWPSMPSFFEMMYMSRNGKKLPAQDKFRSLRVFDHLTPKDLHDNHALATRIVRRQVVGIRYEMEVPKKFLKYFRYRDGFLILTVRFAIPIGLVRFLLARWVDCYASLWLVEPCRLKFYLRRHIATEFLSSLGSVDATIGCENRAKTRAKVNSSKRRYQQQRKLEKQWDQKMKSFGLDPALF